MSEAPAQPRVRPAEFLSTLSDRFRPRSAISAEAPNFRPAYRPDIDGLRAVAILAVVGYHVFPEWLQGGFVGVDVFFVISGFLISTIIFRSLAGGSFSFLEFYVHRVRRIFPALIVVIAFCLLLGWRVLLPSEFEYLGKHVAASAGFFQNIVLSRESGYFDIASELKPLNHLWSLAIEEQFYAIFPLLVWAAWRRGVNLFTLVAAIFALSFAANVIAVAFNHDIGAFFSLGTRAWQLMAGALVAGAKLAGVPAWPLDLAQRWNWRLRWPSAVDPARAYAHGRALLSALGLALIVYAALSYTAAMPYPGVPAAAPVLGAVLLIVSGPAALVNRHLLSSRLAVFFGRISYPLYLWHWPLLSYLTIVDGAVPRPLERIVAAILSVALAWFTYRSIERPIRAAAASANAIAAYLLAGMAFLAVLGLNSKHLTGGYDVETANVMQYWNFRGYPEPEGLYIDERHNLRAVGHNGKTVTLFVGDSHGDQYEDALGAAVKVQAESGAGEVAEVMFMPVRGFPSTLAPELVNDPSITTVAFSFFWALRYGSSQINWAIRCCGKGLNGTIGQTGPRLTADAMDELDRQLKTLTVALRDAGKQVYFVLDNPFGEEAAPRSLLKRSLFRRIELVLTPFPTQTAIARAEPARSRIINVARETGAKIIDPIADLCGPEVCPALWPDGLPVYKDYDHLSQDTVMNHVRYLDVLVAGEAKRAGD
jgi:peptidoglycan/LPS O-acetylase OafA/YrhL